MKVNHTSSGGYQRSAKTVADSTLTSYRGTRRVLWLYLANSRAGRIMLHLVCLFRSTSPRWHWRGICRELGWGTATTT